MNSIERAIGYFEAYDPFMASPEEAKLSRDIQEIWRDAIINAAEEAGEPADTLEIWAAFGKLVNWDTAEKAIRGGAEWALDAYFDGVPVQDIVLRKRAPRMETEFINKVEEADGFAKFERLPPEESMFVTANGVEMSVDEVDYLLARLEGICEMLAKP